MNNIKFPIEVSEIKTQSLYGNKNKPNSWCCKCGQLVQVRPCDEKYKSKTFLGILLGDLPLEIFITYNKESKELHISGYDNPAIFVPELREIIWGCESWWGEIKNEEELRQISDDDIQNVWYVKMLKTMAKENKEKGSD